MNSLLRVCAVLASLVAQALCAVCPICGANSSSFVHHRHDLRGCSVHKCNACGIFFTADLPSEAEVIHRLYDKTTMKSQPRTTWNHQVPMVPTSFVGRRSINLVDVIAKHLPADFKQRGARVVDVGCGDGEVLRAFRLRWPDVRLTCLEPDPGAVRYVQNVQLADVPAERLRVVQGIDVASLGNEGADLLVASHVLEHVVEPHSWVNRLITKLRPGGILFLEVPWQAPVTPTHQMGGYGHLLAFNQSTATTLLTRWHSQQLRLLHAGTYDFETADHEWSTLPTSSPRDWPMQAMLRERYQRVTVPGVPIHNQIRLLAQKRERPAGSKRQHHYNR